MNALPQTMEWSDVRLFLAVMRQGSLGAAARELKVAQPTVGRRITALEKSVGVALFQRTPQGLTATEAGQSVLAAAERMEEESLHFQRRLAGEARDLSGTLRITASDWFGSHVLTPALAEFGAAHPGVEIELLTDSRPYDLGRREADLAFRITPFESLEIVSRRFACIEYALYGTADSPPLRKLGQGARIVTMSTSYAAMPDVQWLGRRLPRARITFRSNSREAQARAAANGMGLAVLPVPLAENFPGLVRMKGLEPPPSRSTWLGYHGDLRRLGRLRALLDFLEQRFPIK